MQSYFRFRSIIAIIVIAVSGYSFMKTNLSHGPVYPGGEQAMDQYLKDSLIYPAEQLLKGNEEVVSVGFEISAEGKAQNPYTHALFGHSANFEDEVKRLINNMPNWDPAVDKKGKPIASSKNVIVWFGLPDSLAEKFALTPDTSLYPGFDSIEIMPQFQGSEVGFQNYLRMTIRYPQMEKEQGRDGTVYIYFEVNKFGKIENTKCVKGVVGAPGLAKEAIRVISAMPRWVPGYMQGRPVKVTMTVPVRFTLN